MVLDKKTILFERDDKGELIPQEVELIIDENDEEQVAFKGETIIITPIPRGEMKRIFSDIRTLTKQDDNERDIDAEIVSKHCVEPKLTLDEAKMLKPFFSGMIVDTIFSISGVDSNKKKTRKENFQKAEDDFAKN